MHLKVEGGKQEVGYNTVRVFLYETVRGLGEQAARYEHCIWELGRTGLQWREFSSGESPLSGAEVRLPVNLALRNGVRNVKLQFGALNSHHSGTFSIRRWRRKRKVALVCLSVGRKSWAQIWGLKFRIPKTSQMTISETAFAKIFKLENFLNCALLEALKLGTGRDGDCRHRTPCKYWHFDGSRAQAFKVERKALPEPFHRKAFQWKSFARNLLREVCSVF